MLQKQTMYKNGKKYIVINYGEEKSIHHMG